MKIEIGNRMSEWRQEMDQAGDPAVGLVLHLLEAAYRRGEIKSFARHCCQWTKIQVEGRMEVGTEKPDVVQ